MINRTLQMQELVDATLDAVGTKNGARIKVSGDWPRFVFSFGGQQVDVLFYTPVSPSELYERIMSCCEKLGIEEYCP